MNNEINNTGKRAQQSSEQSPDDKSSLSTAKDNAALIRRRSLLKGLGAAPLVVTLHSGAAMAASSTGTCVGKRGLDPDGCVAGTAQDHDSFLRVEVGNNGKAEGYHWDTNGQHPYYDPQESERNQCLVSVDADGNIHIDRVKEDRVVATSCWTSFV
mgnify:CR=1 FL=1